MKNQNISFISRECSLAIKGLLIFLIILGHNTFFSKLSTIGMVYLYLFHIYSFFMLPFLYPNNKLTRTRILNYFSKLYYPFICLYIFLSIIHLLCEIYGFLPQNVDTLPVETNIHSIHWLVTIFTGNSFMIDYYTGFQFLWFMPVMFSMSIIREYYISANKITRILIIASSFLFYIFLVIFSFRAPYDRSINFYIKLYSVFAIPHALGFYFMGMCSLFVIKLWKKIRKYIIIINPIIFSLATLICFNYKQDDLLPIPDILRWILLVVMPFSFFLLLYQFRDILSKSSILCELGKYSFLIYIIHPFILKILALILLKYIENSFLLVVIVQVCVTYVSFLLAKLVNRNVNIKKFIFPNTWGELIGNFYKTDGYKKNNKE